MQYEYEYTEIPVFFIDADGALLARHTVYEELFKPTLGSTFVVPPDDEENKTAFFNRDTQTWSMVTDYRGQVVYNKETKDIDFVDYVGELLPKHTMDFPNNVEVTK